MVTLFIAKRIFGQEGEHDVSIPAIRIATVGVAIGLAVMIITVSVVLGFKHTIRDKVVGFGSHIRIESFMAQQTASPVPICISDTLARELKKMPEISHVERYTITQGILKTDADFLGVAFKGIGADYDLHFLQQNLKAGKIPQFSTEKSSYQLLISGTMADKLHLKVNDRVYAYFIGNENVRARKFTIAGIYETHMNQFDQALCFTDYPTPLKLNGWEKDQCSGAEILVHDFDHLDAAAKKVQLLVNHDCDRYGETFTAQTIHDLYPQIFTWLDLLDINVWIILALMICVAGFTMISGLLIIILERTSTIGLLKALGARNSTIRKTFRWLALGIVVKGMVWGNIIGIGICLLQEKFGIVKLDPTAYYVSEAPVEMNWIIILLLNIVTLIITIAVLVIPSFFIGTVRPAKTMRME